MDSQDEKVASLLRIEVKPTKLSGQESMIILITDESQIINYEKNKLKQNF